MNSYILNWGFILSTSPDNYAIPSQWGCMEGLRWGHQEGGGILSLSNLHYLNTKQEKAQGDGGKKKPWLEGKSSESLLTLLAKYWIL